MQKLTEFGPGNLPSTDSEVEALILSSYEDELTGKNIVGIFKTFRARNVPLIEAYRRALVAHLEVAGYTFDEEGRMTGEPPTTV